MGDDRAKTRGGVVGPSGGRRRLIEASALLAVVGVGTALRLWGADYGLPLVFNIDEPLFVRRGLLTAQNLDPRWYNAPAATIHMLLGGIYALMYHMDGGSGALTFGAWVHRELASVTRLVLIGRLACGCVDALTVSLVFVLVRRMGRPFGEAILAGLLYALSAQGIAMAHVIRQDALMTFFMTAAGIAVATLACRPSRGAALVAGGCAGLAAASKWPGGVALAAVPVASLLRRWRAHRCERIEDGALVDRAPPRSVTWVIALALALAGGVLVQAGATLDAQVVERLGAIADKPVTTAGITFMRRNLIAAGMATATAGLLGPCWPAWASEQTMILADPDPWVSCAACGLAFLASAPRIVGQWRLALVGTMAEARSERPPLDGDPGLCNLIYYVTGPLSGDLMPWGLLLAVIGMGAALHSGECAAMAVAVTPIAYLLYMSLGPLRWPHYVLPIVPFAVAFVARGVAVVAECVGRPWIAVVLGALVAAMPLKRAIEDARTYGHPLTQAAATEWFIRHAPPHQGLRVLTETSDVMLEPGGYQLTRVWGVGQIDPALITRRRFDWVILSSSVDDAFMDRADRYPEAASCYAHVLSRWPAAARFDPHPPDLEGPSIRICVPPPPMGPEHPKSKPDRSGRMPTRRG